MSDFYEVLLWIFNRFSELRVEVRSDDVQKIDETVQLREESTFFLNI